MIFLQYFLLQVLTIKKHCDTHKNQGNTERVNSASSFHISSSHQLSHISDISENNFGVFSIQGYIAYKKLTVSTLIAYQNR